MSGNITGMHLVIDVLLALAVVAACISGWRQGALSAVLSAIGVVAGLVIGLALAPFVLDLSESQTCLLYTSPSPRD